MATASSKVTDCPAVSETTLNESTTSTSPPSLNESKSDAAIPYHVFSRQHKWAIVCLVSSAGLFSPLSSNIYFPAIQTISHDLHVQPSLVALTISIYMVVQGIAPSVFGSLSDTYGRRVIFIVTFLIYIVANLALAFTSNFPMLLVLRGLQAAGSSANISISAGVIADIASPQERGGFIGTNSGIRMVGQAFGPVIGGLLNGVWGYKSIFWFLFVLSSLVLLILLVFLPETHRSIAGNGSVKLSGLNRPIAYMIHEPSSQVQPAASSFTPKSARSILQEMALPLIHVAEKDIFVLLLWGALVYTVWSMVTSSTTTVLLGEFPSLTQLEVGLCFLPNGVGCMLGSILTGRFMDWNYKRIEAQCSMPDNGANEANGGLKKSFPYEKARLLPMPYASGVLIIMLAVYGSSYELNDIWRYNSHNLALTLILQFLIAFTATAVFCINSTMLVDCFSKKSAGATATNNLARCLLGAVGVSVIEPLIKAVRIRNAFLILAGIVLLFSPLVWVEWKYGEKWRLQREVKQERKESLSGV